GGAVDRRGAGDPVPAGGHSSSALASHRLLRRLLLFCRSKARAERAGRANIVAAKVRPAATARNRRAFFPAGCFFERIQRAQKAHRAELLLGVADGAVTHRIDAANLERIESEPFGGNVEMRF